MAEPTAGTMPGPPLITMATQDTPEADPERWSRLISLLSMDVVLPFFEPMGLVLPGPGHDPHSLESEVNAPPLPFDAPHRLQRALRHEIVQGRRVRARDGHVPTPSEMLRHVTPVVGGLTMQRLSWWGTRVFSDDPAKDHTGLNDWRPVLAFCVRDPELWSKTGLSQSARQSFVESLRIDDYETLQADIDQLQLSDWDLHLYALELYDDTLYDGDFAHILDGPRLWVRPTVRAHRQYRFWSTALRALTVAQQRQLLDFGRAIAREEDILAKPETLPDPRELEIFS